METEGFQTTSKVRRSCAKSYTGLKQTKAKRCALEAGQPHSSVVPEDIRPEKDPHFG